MKSRVLPWVPVLVFCISSGLYETGQYMGSLIWMEMSIVFSAVVAKVME